MHRLAFALGAIVVSALMSSCASVSVREVSAKPGAEKPKRIYVAPFAVLASGVKENPARRNPGQLGAEAQRILQAYTVQEVGKLGIPTLALAGGTKAPADGWVVTGTITRLAEGNRLLRMSIGLGAGGTKMETRVAVLAATRPILDFATSGGSNATPGGLTNPIPFSGVPTAILKANDGVTDDAARTSRMIAGTIGRNLAERGWISSAAVPEIKRARAE
jgi:hypothetical protein